MFSLQWLMRHKVIPLSTTKPPAMQHNHSSWQGHTPFFVVSLSIPSYTPWGSKHLIMGTLDLYGSLKSIPSLFFLKPRSYFSHIKYFKAHFLINELLKALLFTDYNTVQPKQHNKIPISRQNHSVSLTFIMDSIRDGRDTLMRCCIKLEVATVCLMPSVLAVFFLPAFTFKHKTEVIKIHKYIIK